jgi:hypothetical protein
VRICQAPPLSSVNTSGKPFRLRISGPDSRAPGHFPATGTAKGPASMSL